MSEQMLVSEKYIENLISGKSLVSTLKSLSNFFKKNSMYFEQAMLTECLHRFDSNPEWFQKVGDIFNFDLNDNQMALEFYMKYIKEMHPEFYSKFKETAHKNNINIYEFKEFSFHFDKVCSGLSKLTARCKALICVLKYYARIQNKSEIMRLKPLYNKLYEETCKYMVESEPCNMDSYTDLCEFQNELSKELTNIKNHNDINNFAIELDPLNECAYINIIDDYLTYKNYSQAIDFYNNRYAPKFKVKQESSAINLFWFVSDKLYNYGDFFNSVRCQKCAIDLELSK